ncbi:Uncharacterized protein FWK35_00027466, partial [Aphis craccivora]
ILMIRETAASVASNKDKVRGRGDLIGIEKYVNYQEKLPKDGEDIKCINGIFSWKTISEYHVICITRVINGEEFKFVSKRMAETQLLSNYMPYLHADIYTCTLYISKKLLNQNELYTKDPCTVTSLDDIKNFFPPETHFEEYWFA